MNAMWEGTTNDFFDLAKYETNHVVGGYQAQSS